MSKKDTYYIAAFGLLIIATLMYLYNIGDEWGLVFVLFTGVPLAVPLLLWFVIVRGIEHSLYRKNQNVNQVQRKTSILTFFKIWISMIGLIGLCWAVADFFQ